MITALDFHSQFLGKIAVTTKVSVNTLEDLALAYTPGVAEPCLAIAKNTDDVYKYTAKGNLVAIVSDGTAVLGLGDIGPEAAIPVMEGKAILFKKFANVDAFPICVRTKNVDEIVQLVKWLEPTFGGINLEDISAPRCFEIEKRLKQELNIPVFHDDQHGTAIVVLAGLINALKIVDKTIANIKIVINGAGAAGIAIAQLLILAGAKNIVICDSKGIISHHRNDLNSSKIQLLNQVEINPNNEQGNVKIALNKADVFIGVSVANILQAEDIKTMNAKSIVLAMANPVPEIMPDEAKKGGAMVVGTGRSDFPNQINNVLAFPGVFRGVLDARAKIITDEMKLAAAFAIASCIKSPTSESIIPSVFNEEVAEKVAKAIIKII